MQLSSGNTKWGQVSKSWSVPKEYIFDPKEESISFKDPLSRGQLYIVTGYFCLFLLYKSLTRTQSHLLEVETTSNVAFYLSKSSDILV